ncbi:pilin [Legionella septentrionalis]|uniref:Prepilin-type N-terminal cleavage/methylation domain-containing protein n=1 Tax=Legionella septentrionalis TaxID=2498109 RepID=A0A3S1CLX9_9GAMM|nr:pilin [Legionella septentrionalis]RUQ89254.1 prepilin-type N-terminal cleavage/methylation domain-containing protein [Legionella septentrionalis]RUQ94621.1 prepilin-type N-terminal cleavage/methylation domain-containing protein [Legionella septentrionalis]RUR17400.1 prepilin-type N-terminal cleavage/methylation domain-containing protein [Legionella septentrionalis]
MRQQGFTLIEVMIVVVIVGILVAIAVPFYQDYTVRSRVLEGLNAASVAKLAVSETAIANNALPATQEETGYLSPAATDNVDSIAIADDGTATITITFTSRAGGGTIFLVPTLNQDAGGVVTWRCTGGTLAAKFRPVNCR